MMRLNNIAAEDVSRYSSVDYDRVRTQDHAKQAFEGKLNAGIGAQAGVMRGLELVGGAMVNDYRRGQIRGLQRKGEGRR